jgi:hypothetical protein
LCSVKCLRSNRDKQQRLGKLRHSHESFLGRDYKEPLLGFDANEKMLPFFATTFLFPHWFNHPSFSFLSLNGSLRIQKYVNRAITSEFHTNG